MRRIFLHALLFPLWNMCNAIDSNSIVLLHPNRHNSDIFFQASCPVQAIPAELQRLQRYKNLLLENTEKVLLSVHPVRQTLCAWTFSIRLGAIDVQLAAYNQNSPAPWLPCEQATARSEACQLAVTPRVQQHHVQEPPREADAADLTPPWAQVH